MLQDLHDIKYLNRAKALRGLESDRPPEGRAGDAASVAASGIGTPPATPPATTPATTLPAATPGTATPGAVTNLGAAAIRLRKRGWAVLTGAGFTDGHRVDLTRVRELARWFGIPSARDGGADIWPVRPISRDPGQTFSQRTGGALLHTDAAYRDAPEPLFALFCVRPACAGGHSRLLTAEDATTGLDPEVLAALRRPVWQWLPPAIFGGPPGHARPVLAGTNTISWRFDNLEVTGELRTIAARFRDHIEGHRNIIEFALTADSMLVCDNTAILHGRTSFTDPSRLLLRVRMEHW
jgi:hypothetical protein